MYMACNAYILEDGVVHIWVTDCLKFVFWVTCMILEAKVNFLGKIVILFNVS